MNLEVENTVFIIIKIKYNNCQILLYDVPPAIQFAMMQLLDSEVAPGQIDPLQFLFLTCKPSLHDRLQVFQDCQGPQPVK